MTEDEPSNVVQLFARRARPEQWGGTITISHDPDGEQEFSATARVVGFWGRGRHGRSDALSSLGEDS